MQLIKQFTWMDITECGDTACGFDCGLMALLSLHLSSVSNSPFCDAYKFLFQVGFMSF